MWTVLPPFQNRVQIVCKERLPLFQQQSSYKQVAVVFLVSCSASPPSDLWVWIIQGFYYTSSFSKLVVVLLLKRVRLEPEGKSWWKLLQFHTTLCAKDWTATIATRYTFTYFSCTILRVFPDTVYPETIYPETAFPETVYPETIYPETVYSEAGYPETVHLEIIYVEPIFI